VLAQMNVLVTVDNFEGVAARQMPDGRVRLYVVSDEQFFRQAAHAAHDLRRAKFRPELADRNSGHIGHAAAGRTSSERKPKRAASSTTHAAPVRVLAGSRNRRDGFGRTVNRAGHFHRRVVGFLDFEQVDERAARSLGRVLCRPSRIWRSGSWSKLLSCKRFSAPCTEIFARAGEANATARAESTTKEERRAIFELRL